MIDATTLGVIVWNAVVDKYSWGLSIVDYPIVYYQLSIVDHPTVDCRLSIIQLSIVDVYHQSSGVNCNYVYIYMYIAGQFVISMGGVLAGQKVKVQCKTIDSVPVYTIYGKTNYTAL